MIEALIASFLTISAPAWGDDVSMDMGKWDEFNRKEASCLAENVYHEARNQPLAGQMAVISVTINRVNDDRFPNNICDVVYQGPHRPSWKGTGEMIPIRHKCQFSWYCDGKSDKIRNQDAWYQAKSIASALISMRDMVPNIVEDATHYHAHYVNPHWASKLEKVTRIDSHIFYRVND